VTMTEATSDGDVVRGIESVSLSEGGYVAVYDENGLNGTLLGHTEYLPAGTHSDVVVPLREGAINESGDIHVVVHHDSNGNKEFDFRPPYSPSGGQADRPYTRFGQGDQPSIEVEVTYIGAGSETGAETEESLGALAVGDSVMTASQWNSDVGARSAALADPAQVRPPPLYTTG